MKSITRKVNLSLYNGNQYENIDVHIEDDIKDFPELLKEVDTFIARYIQNILPKELKIFEKAKMKQGLPKEPTKPEQDFIDSLPDLNKDDGTKTWQ